MGEETEEDFWKARGWGTSGKYDELEEEDAIGSEYGEGFVQYRPSGQPLHVDVEHLNSSMRKQGRERLRMVLKPDEAFGTIVVLEGLLLDTKGLQMSMWRRLAAEEKLPMPSIPRAVHNVRPERVISEVFMWAIDWKEVRRLSFRANEIYEELLDAQAAQSVGRASPTAGAATWLQALQKHHIPCALVTKMGRKAAQRLLEGLGLRSYFSALVTEEDGMETKAQRLLSAAVKLSRAPDTCVVFEADPRGVTAAHNASMKAVGVTTLLPAYEFEQADLTIGSMDELSIINVRRLFANAGTEWMDLAKEGIDGPDVPRNQLRTGLDTMERPEEFADDVDDNDD